MDYRHKAPARNEMQPFQYYWDGVCAPKAGLAICYTTFSVGIFMAKPKANAKGCKRGAAVCRVKGWTKFPDQVFKTADDFCESFMNGFDTSRLKKVYDLTKFTPVK